MGFGNTPHCDLCDAISNKISQSWRVDLPEGTVMQWCVDQISEQVGVGLTTTCGCGFIGVQKSSSESLAHFCQMQFCMPLEHNIGHQFFGWAFAHCTSLPTLLDEGKHCHRDKSETENFVIAAWGSGGRSEEATARQTAQTEEQTEKEKETASPPGSP